LIPKITDYGLPIADCGSFARFTPIPLVTARSAYLEALHLLAGRELSVQECRARLEDREYPAAQIQAAIHHLLETRALDDERVARAHARAAAVKTRGRLRVIRELQARGIAADIVAAAVGEVFGDLDERALVAQAVQKKLRGGRRLSSAAEVARLYQYLMRQGFTPAAVTAELRKMRLPMGTDDL
jgi:SOS response regulatory protein OraA/RecX